MSMDGHAFNQFLFMRFLFMICSLDSSCIDSVYNAILMTRDSFYTHSTFISIFIKTSNRSCTKIKYTKPLVESKTQLLKIRKLEWNLCTVNNQRLTVNFILISLGEQRCGRHKTFFQIISCLFKSILIIFFFFLIPLQDMNVLHISMKQKELKSNNKD